MNNQLPDRIGVALLDAIGKAMLLPNKEVRVTFATENERKEAARRCSSASGIEVLPGMGSFLFDREASTEYQIELKNGSCVVLLLKDNP
jgi:hypothetical protein